MEGAAAAAHEKFTSKEIQALRDTIEIYYYGFKAATEPSYDEWSLIKHLFRSACACEDEGVQNRLKVLKALCNERSGEVMYEDADPAAWDSNARGTYVFFKVQQYKQMVDAAAAMKHEYFKSIF
jgi:hypothetical protein